MVWWPWAPLLGLETDARNSGSLAAVVAGLHFMAATCLYDGMLTYVEVNHSALLAEMTTSPTQRAAANAMSAIAAAAGSATSFLGYLAYGGDSPAAFRVVVVCVALVCVFVFEFAALGVDTYGGAPSTTTITPQPSAVAKPPPSGAPPALRVAPDRSSSDASSGSTSGTRSYWTFLRQLAASRSFLAFVVLATAQTFDCTFEKNFYVPFMDTLTADGGSGGEDGADTHTISRSTRGAFISASFLLPHLLTVAWTPLIRRRGLHATLTLVFATRLVILAVAAAAGRASPLAVMVVRC